MPVRIWEYYKRLAEVIGTDSDGRVQGFSVSWFYEMMSEGGIGERLNNLSLAYLNQPEALENVRMATSEELSLMCARVRELCGDGLNPSQIEAVSNAVLNDVTLIQGPPGTGKTETIKNILLTLHNIDPRANIAVISANAEAINNAEDVIKDDPALGDKYLRMGSRSVRMALKSELLARNPELNNRLDTCNKENEWLYPESILEIYPIILSTIHSLKKCVNITEYDYVLVDECSQVPSFLGMLALSSAKHIVLLGDDEQLPPIHKDRENDDIVFVQQIREEAPWYLDEKDNSFMKACKASFGDKCGKILLNEHYRCHPAIIGFCNRYIYDGQLISKTYDDGKLPIRIRWYEGDYWEEVHDTETGKGKKYNKKQIEVFVKDEMPDILDVLRNDNDYSICVLSPYRYQLELLKNRLEELVHESGLIENVLEEEQTDVKDIAQLTIHKAQGRGYDRVYIMPVEDCGRTPWSQKRELINVAVSRAKRELVVVTTSAWMPEGLQKRLTGYRIGNNIDNNECYIRELLAYTEEELERRQADEGYGFVRASDISVFDKVLYYRMRMGAADERNRTEESFVSSAAEYCLKTALENATDISSAYSIYQEVPIKAIDGIDTDDEEVRRYIDNDARLDFVIAREKNVYAIIEVDGAYHRDDLDTMRNDALKDQAVASIGEEFAEKRFIRLLTDGTTKNEIELIRNILNDTEAPYAEMNKNIKGESSMKEQLAAMLDEMILNSADRLADIVTGGTEDEKERLHNAIRKLNYSGTDAQYPTAEDYSDEVFCAYYLARYGYAYAFEYWVIYDAILRTYLASEEGSDGDPVLGVSSMACGSMIDAWGLAYAFWKIREEEPERIPQELNLSYHGEDITRWGRFFAGEAAVLDTVNNCLRYTPTYSELGAEHGIVEFIRNTRNYHWLNVQAFNKVLNEIPDMIGDIESAISEAINNGDYVAENSNNRNEYYICISHSKTALENDETQNELTERIINAFNCRGSFDVDRFVMEHSGSPLFGMENDGRVVGVVNYGDENIPLYGFNECEGSKGVYLNEINPDFLGNTFVNDRIRELFGRSSSDDSLLRDFDDGIRQPMTRTHYSRFQIIKLTRRENN